MDRSQQRETCRIVLMIFNIFTTLHIMFICSKTTVRPSNTDHPLLREPCDRFRTSSGSDVSASATRPFTSGSAVSYSSYTHSHPHERNSFFVHFFFKFTPFLKSPTCAHKLKPKAKHQIALPDSLQDTHRWCAGARRSKRAVQHPPRSTIAYIYIYIYIYI